MIFFATGTGSYLSFPITTDVLFTSLIHKKLGIIPKEMLASSFNQIIILITAILVLLLLLGAVAFYILVERSTLGSIQRRKGPNVVGFYGLLQSVADGVKLFSKETTMPASGNTGIFISAPIISFFTGLAVWAVIPFGENAVFSNINLGFLYLTSVSSIGVYAIIMSGWSSNSKYAFLGAVRSAAQMISYELAFGFSLLNVFMLVGSLNLSEIVHFQKYTIWLVFPLLPMFLIFFITTLVETGRHPFDLPEAEAELVAGYNVEYSSMTFGLFFLGEYSAVLSMCALSTVIFFGGWLPIFDSLSFIPGPIWFSIKLYLLSLLFIIARGVLPRYRYDQLMALGWVDLFPICLFCTLFFMCLFRISSFYF